MTKENTQAVHDSLGIPFPPSIPAEWLEEHGGWDLFNLYKNNPYELELMQAGACVSWATLNQDTSTSWIREMCNAAD